MNPEDLMERMAATLRRDIGPAVEDPFAKTQAFMAAVILEKLGRQLRLTATHARAEGEELAALVEDLEETLDGSSDPRVGAALEGLRSGNGAALGALVAALYSARGQLGPERFEAGLRRVRRTLRQRLDRQLEFAS